MAKKKSLFKKLRKNESSLVAEPEAPVDDSILESISQPKVEEVVRPAIVRKPYIAPKKTYPAKIDIEVNKNDIFGALNIAKQAVIEDAGKSEYVGEFYSIDSDEERVATYLFHAKLPGYSGWMWAVTVAKVDDKSPATICDVVLLPGAKSLLAPNWVPYSQRIQPGDLGVRAPIAQSAPKPCSSCGFFIPIAGSLRSAFGVCANAISPEDARVVSVDHGCGAHSEALIKAE